MDMVGFMVGLYTSISYCIKLLEIVFYIVAIPACVKYLRQR
ncbi:MAG: hypothetical protein AAGU02_05505 [Lawsonibacter sp.]